MEPKPCPDCSELPAIVADESKGMRVWNVSHRCAVTNQVWRGARSTYKNDAVDVWNAEVTAARNFKRSVEAKEVMPK